MTSSLLVRAGAILGAFALALSAAACSSPSPSGSAPADDSETYETVRIGWHTGTELRFYAAQALGTFDDIGLPVEFVRFNDGPSKNLALQAGEIDVAFSGTPGFLVALQAGVDAKVIALEGASDLANKIVVNSETIGSVEDLRGKTIGVSLGTTGWLTVKAALEQVGLSLADVELKNLTTSQMVPAFTRGEVDAVSTWAPITYLLEEAGAEELITEKQAGMPDPELWFARSEWLTDHPEEATKFIEALDHGTDLLESERSQVAREIASIMAVSEPHALRILDEVPTPALADTVDYMESDELEADILFIHGELVEGEFIDATALPESAVAGRVDSSLLRSYLDAK
ncbi:NrtA/SsuA/CpmA family ABC transporter substrate-binding protein [Microbacterium soli]|uniref:ABC transporter substrate-binding protein n=1 Tax=Microbacterium soli TaxID=446075 RepID=A0ABP7NBU2_9MICO